VNRLLVFATVVALAVAASGVLLAQSNPFVGTWKLNPAKSKVTSGASPKEETLTFQMVGKQRQFTLNGTWADGSPISIKYETPDKGGVGKFLAGPFDGASGKVINDNTREITWMKGGKEMVHIHTAVSKDGKTQRTTVKGTNAQSNPVSGVEVWDKQ
jgi:hypothetical protein